MKTLEMMNESAKTGKVYKSNYMRYSSDEGFTDIKGYRWYAEAFVYINNVMNLSWEIVEPKKMTLKEIEEILGYQIEIVSEK